MKSDFVRIRLCATVLAGLLTMAGRGAAGDLSLPVTGSLMGSVIDNTGAPQMGAVVFLLDKFQRQIGKTLTTPDGRFGFADLSPDQYGLRVSVPSFLPAFRDHIAVRAGLDSVLHVHLATLLSNIEVSYTLPSAVMTDDWKWVLRSAPATRPISRYLPVEETSSSAGARSKIFSSTHAMVSVSGGDSAVLDDSETQDADLGTSFALSTNMFGKNQVQLSGTFGQAPGTGTPLIGFSVVYSREDAGGFTQAPEVTLTMRQLAFADRQSSPDAIAASSPLVRDASVTIYETADVADDVHLEYGATGESISSLHHTSRISPFARVTVKTGDDGSLSASYSNGARPNALYGHQQGQETAFGETVDSAANLPQLSYRDGNLQVQRTQSYELGYRETMGSRTYAASLFYEDISNGRVSVAGDTSQIDSGDLLWDGNSKTAAYNIGRFNRTGYIASVDQRIGNSLNLAVAYGRMGGFTPINSGAATLSGGSFLSREDSDIAAVSLHAKAPVAGTQITVNYGWVNNSIIVPRHTFTTQDMQADPGLNVTVRQPLPSLFGMPGHLEIVADARNILAQGYLKDGPSDARKLLILQAPRAIRGGLNFIF